MKVSKHFKSEEFACKCGCGFDAVSIYLIDMLEAARRHFGKPIIINSACRCKAHNEKVGGKPGSRHTMGMAADIVVKGVSPSTVAYYFEQMYPTSCGVGRYDTFTHIDCRPQLARWDYTSDTQNA